jgi:hypothetical protein
VRANGTLLLLGAHNINQEHNARISREQGTASSIADMLGGVTAADPIRNRSLNTTSAVASR